MKIILNGKEYLEELFAEIGCTWGMETIRAAVYVFEVPCLKINFMFRNTHGVRYFSLICSILRVGPDGRIISLPHSNKRPLMGLPILSNWSVSVILQWV
jgi:hypothetical protein